MEKYDYMIILCIKFIRTHGHKQMLDMYPFRLMNVSFGQMSRTDNVLHLHWLAAHFLFMILSGELARGYVVILWQCMERLEARAPNGTYLSHCTVLHRYYHILSPRPVHVSDTVYFHGNL